MAAAAQLPVFPRFVFTILEPASLLGGFLAPFVATEYFISSQLVRTYIGSYDDNSQLLAYLLGNCYLLLGILGVFILNTTSEIKVVRAYLWALWLGDIGHVSISLFMMGLDEILEPTTWTATIIGNTLFTIFLFAVRSLYLSGLLDGSRPRGTTGPGPGPRQLRQRKPKGKRT